MKKISASEANRRFSTIFGQVKAGAEYTITSHGKAAARLIPVKSEDEERERARALLVKRLRSRPISGKPRDWTREDLYQD